MARDGILEAGNLHKEHEDETLNVVLAWHHFSVGIVAMIPTLCTLPAYILLDCQLWKIVSNKIREKRLLKNNIFLQRARPVSIASTRERNRIEHI